MAICSWKSTEIFTIRWKLTEIESIKKRRFNQTRSSIEIFFTDTSSYVFYLVNRDVDTFLSKLAGVKVYKSNQSLMQTLSNTLHSHTNPTIGSTERLATFSTSCGSTLCQAEAIKTWLSILCFLGFILDSVPLIFSSIPATFGTWPRIWETLASSLARSTLSRSTSRRISTN